MKTNRNLLLDIQSFFQDYLSGERGLSKNTIWAYRDAVKLFLSFAAKFQGKQTSKLKFEDLNAAIVLAFLKEIEKSRQNSATTRNLRLAALKSFFGFMLTKDPLRVGEYQKILAIPQKRSVKPIMDYLEAPEVTAMLNAIKRSGDRGERDYVLLSLLYNTGARVQEICDIRVGDIRLDEPPLVTITGKGRKVRHVPLWPETSRLLKTYLERIGVIGRPTEKLFYNQRNEPISRFGVSHIIKKIVANSISKCPSLKNKKIGPHTFRHTTAMHLLQAGVDLTVIKSWLGHVNLATTHAYIEIDLDMKRRALSACSPLGTLEGLKKLVDRNRDIVSWLESL